MPTNKQTFEANMKQLSDVINAKRGITASNKQTIAQMITAVSSMNVVKSLILT